MKFSQWSTEIKASADPDRTGKALRLLSESPAAAALSDFNRAQKKQLCTLLSGSEYAASLLASHSDWLAFLRGDTLQFARRKQGLKNELHGLVEPLRECSNYTGAFECIRRFRQREILRIASRDLCELAAAPEIIRELSDLADVCLEAVWEICSEQVQGRFGLPFEQDATGKWKPSRGCVLGLGKLGGQELNYSSDVDVIFVYSEEGETFRETPGKKPPAKSVVKNHVYFNRLAETFITEVSRMSPEGVLYRIDLRLRPEGDQGPLNRSITSYENYYSQWGQTWERMMLIKARCVAGDEGVAAEFLEMVQPFRYPRSINPNVLREVAAMKDRIESEVVKAGELERNVKLGWGGIREIEFLCQSFQLLFAGRQPFLQGAQTIPTLQKLRDYEHLDAAQCQALSEAYVFLRKLEHRLQMENNLQTHTLPAESAALQRIARLMGFGSLVEFQKRFRAHTQAVRGNFERVLKGEGDGRNSPGLPSDFSTGADTWKQILASHGFRDPERGLKVLREFVEGPGFGHVSTRTKDLALKLVPHLFRLCPGEERDTWIAGQKRSNPAVGIQPPLSDPDRVATRLDSFIAAYGARSTLFELWHGNPAIFELLVLLFDRSEFLAELAIRTPDLVDELVMSDRLRERKSANQTLADLLHGIADADQFAWIRKYHQAELMRIGLRDILNLADFEQYMAELSALADACLQYALAATMRKHRLKKPPFVIIGLGKLGGAEIDYGSDLDILFVANNKVSNHATLSRYAVEIMELLARRTEQGLVFHVDARLRPDGEKGLLVNSLEAYQDYYRKRAMLWEIQSLTRVRAVAGDEVLGGEFERMAEAFTDFRTPPKGLAAWSEDWKDKIHQMRMRIEKERTPKGKDALAIKTGSGGVMDAEFISQAACLANGWQEPNTLRALERAGQMGFIPKPGRLIEAFRSLRRVEGVLRRWSYEGETVLPDDPAPFYRVAVRCGFGSAQQFAEAVAQWRKQIRQAYDNFFE